LNNSAVYLVLKEHAKDKIDAVGAEVRDRGIFCLKTIEAVKNVEQEHPASVKHSPNTD
jgi:hypothetical protein